MLRTRRKLESSRSRLDEALTIAVTEGGRSVRSVLVRPRLAFSSFPSYNAFTNQVPATWIVGEVGIRRLASHSDGPLGGRHFVFTLSGVAEQFFSSTC